MSLQATRWAWAQELPATAKLVLLALAECVNGRDGQGACYPGQGRIAAMCGISDRQVRNVLRDLEYRGLVETVHRPGTGRGRRSNVYRLVCAGNRKPASGSEVPDAREQTETQFRKPISSCPGGNRKQTSGGNRKPISGEPEEGTGRREKPPSPSPSCVESTAKHEEAAPATPVRNPTGSLSGSDTQRFERFWSAYPRKVAKGEARKAWRQIGPDDGLTERICRALAVARESEQWRRDAGRFIPYPATWLRREGWEDQHIAEVAPLPAGAGSERVRATITNLEDLFGGRHGAADLSAGDDLSGGRLLGGDAQGEGGGVLGPARKSGGRAVLGRREGGGWQR
ncbi:helix-turn-helix domain-containing protein [Aquisalimonas sp. 2447]|nr:helix-turn-helix domain-containing protein [Aquisalimonas sp. 2447]